MEAVIDELEFYSKFARPLIFALPDAEDRVKASAWVQKIKETEAGSEKLRKDYIKLLLFALQRKKLVGIFADDPAKYGVLEAFPPGHDLNTFAKKLIEKEQQDRVRHIQQQFRGQTGDSPPYTTDCSADLREYVAAQDIPGFGVHCYYAISKNAITTWNKSDKGIFPKMAKSVVNTTSPLPSGILPSGIFAQRASDIILTGEAKKEKEEKPKRKSKPKLGVVPPVKPLGTSKPPEEERKPPTWGTSLLEVEEKEPTTASTSRIELEESQLKLGDEPDFDDEMTELEKTLQDYQSGSIKERSHKKDVIDTYVEEIEDYDAGPMLDDFDLDEPLMDETEFDDEVNRDAMLVKYIEDTVETKTNQQDIQRAKAQALSSSPALAGIAITTPRPSASPKRPKMGDKIFKPSIPIPSVAEDQLMEVTMKNPQKDLEVSRLFLETSALIDAEEDFELFDESMPEELFDFDAEAPPEKLMEVEGPPPRLPLAPPPRGSPAANAIASEVISALDKEAEEVAEEAAQGQTADTGAGPVCSDTSPQRILLPEPTEDEEVQYLGYLFGTNQKTMDLLKRVTRLVADVETDEPMPEFPKPLPFYDVGPMPLLMDEMFDELVPPSPPGSPPGRPPGSPLRMDPVPQQQRQPQQSQIGKPSGLPTRSGIPRTAGSKIAQPSRIGQPSRTVQLPPQEPAPIEFEPPSTPWPMYLPPSAPGWPSPDQDLQRRLEEHEIDPEFYHPKRPQMTKRIVVGRTSGRAVPVKKRFVPGQPITEADQEDSLPLTSSYSSPETSLFAEQFPEGFADDSILEFARGYVPPVYQSPTGVLSESPPRFMDDIFSPKQRSPQQPAVQKPPSPQRLAPAKRTTPLAPRKRPVPRKLDYDDTVDTRTYISQLLERHPDLPPLPRSPQREETDAMPGTPQAKVPSPPRDVFGWQSPQSPLKFARMPYYSEMLDFMQPPFDDVEMSPPAYSGSPQSEPYFEPPFAYDFESAGMLDEVQPPFNDLDLSPPYGSSQMPSSFYQVPTSGGMLDSIEEPFAGIDFSPPGMYGAAPPPFYQAPGFGQMPGSGEMLDDIEEPFAGIDFSPTGVSGARQRSPQWPPQRAVPTSPVFQAPAYGEMLDEMEEPFAGIDFSPKGVCGAGQRSPQRPPQRAVPTSPLFQVPDSGEMLDEMEEPFAGIDFSPQGVCGAGQRSPQRPPQRAVPTSPLFQVPDSGEMLDEMEEPFAGIDFSPQGVCGAGQRSPQRPPQRAVPTSPLFQVPDSGEMLDEMEEPFAGIDFSPQGVCGAAQRSPQRAVPRSPVFQAPAYGEMLDAMEAPFAGFDSPPPGVGGAAGYQEDYELPFMVPDFQEDARFNETEEIPDFPPSPPGSPCQRIPAGLQSPQQGARISPGRVTRVSPERVTRVPPERAGTVTPERAHTVTPQRPPTLSPEMVGEMSPSMQEWVENVQRHEYPSTYRGLRRKKPVPKLTAPTSIREFLKTRFERHLIESQNAYIDAHKDEKPRRRRPHPPMMGTIPGSPPPFDQFGLPSVAQYSPLRRYIIGRRYLEEEDAQPQTIQPPELESFFFGPGEEEPPAQSTRQPAGSQPRPKSATERPSRTAVQPTGRAGTTRAATVASARPPPRSAGSAVRPTGSAGRVASTQRLTGARPPGSAPPASAVRPPARGVRPPASAGRPPATAGRPPATAGRPPATAGRPAASAGRPPASAGRPPASAGRPPASAGRPPISGARPPGAAGRPPGAAGRPPGGAGRPITPIASARSAPGVRPTSGSGTRTPGIRPTTSGMRPPAGNGIPPQGSGIRPPPGSGVRPPTSGVRPPTSGVRPPMSGVRPSGSGIRPTGSGIQPTCSGTQPTGSGIRPTGSGMRPTGSGMRPTGSGIRPTGSGIRPTGSGMRPPGSTQLPSGANESRTTRSFTQSKVSTRRPRSN